VRERLDAMQTIAYRLTCRPAQHLICVFGWHICTQEPGTPFRTNTDLPPFYLSTRCNAHAFVHTPLHTIRAADVLATTTQG
jgi:hypothetical protein